MENRDTTAKSAGERGFANTARKKSCAEKVVKVAEYVSTTKLFICAEYVARLQVFVSIAIKDVVAKFALQLLFASMATRSCPVRPV